MKREFMFATVLAAALSIGLSAQTPGQPPQPGQPGQSGAGTMPQSPQSSYAQAPDKNEIMLTGCVASGQSSSSTTGTAGTTGSATGAPPSSSTMGNAPKSQFVLTDASSTPSAAPSTSPSAASNPTVSSTDRIALSGKEKDLQKYVGQKVEISGKWEKSSAPVSSNTFKVSSVKESSGSCSK